MQTTITISPDVLNWIMTQLRYDVPNKIVERLQQWASGEKQPTFNQIEEASKATGIPFGYFLLKKPPVENLSLVEYRTIDSINLKNPSRNLIDTIHDMELVQEWMRDQLLSDGEDALSIVGCLKSESSPKKFASTVRQHLNLDVDWYKSSNSVDASFRRIRNAISNAGVLVMMSGTVGNNSHRPLEPDEFRAFAIVDHYAPLIFINAADSYGGRLFSLLHEFAHICIGENSLYNDRFGETANLKSVEIICNKAAAEILVPQSVFLLEWNIATKEFDVEKAISILAKAFRCSPTVIARRALDFGKIDYTLYRKIAQYAINQYRANRSKSGGDFYRTAKSRIDQRFFKMLSVSVYEGKTLYSEAFRLTNTNRSTFMTLFHQMGGGEIER